MRDYSLSDDKITKDEFNKERSEVVKLAARAASEALAPEQRDEIKREIDIREQYLAHKDENNLVRPELGPAIDEPLYIENSDA